MDSIFGSFDDLYLFCQVVDAGSLQAAAIRLKLPASTISRRLTQLESRLATRLLERRGRELAPTDTGQELYEHIAAELLIAEQGLEQVLADHARVQGHLRLFVPLSMYRNKLQPVIERFLLDFPEVSLDLELSMTDTMPETDRDLVISFDLKDRTDLIARPLFEGEYAVVASPDYLARCGLVDDIAHYDKFDWLSLAHKTRMYYETDGLRKQLTPRVRLKMNDVDMLKSAVKAGLGVAAIPCRHLLEGEGLIRIFKPLEIEKRTAYLVYRQRLHQPRALSLLIERLTDQKNWLRVSKQPLDDNS